MARLAARSAQALASSPNSSSRQPSTQRTSFTAAIVRWSSTDGPTTTRQTSGSRSPTPSPRRYREPPSLVQHTHEAVHWLASAVINLDQDSAETPAALADALGRLLTVCVFADAARDRGGQSDE